jgi:hypothetical protein
MLGQVPVTGVGAVDLADSGEHLRHVPASTYRVSWVGADVGREERQQVRCLVTLLQVGHRDRVRGLGLDDGSFVGTVPLVAGDSAGDADAAAGPHLGDDRADRAAWFLADRGDDLLAEGQQRLVESSDRSKSCLGGGSAQPGGNGFGWCDRRVRGSGVWLHGADDDSTRPGRLRVPLGALTDIADPPLRL